MNFSYGPEHPITPQQRVEVHTIGDSHSRWSFMHVTDYTLRCHWIGPVTMHRVGRDGLVVPKDFPAGSVVMFCFGSIDLDRHIGVQRSRGRDPYDILNDLVSRYFAALDEAIRPVVRCYRFAILGTVPTVGGVEPTDTAEERQQWTEQANIRMRRECVQRNWFYFDMLAGHTNEVGRMIDSITDGNHVLNSPYVVERLGHLTAWALQQSTSD